MTSKGPHAPPLRGSLPPEGADPAWGGPTPDRALSSCFGAADAVLARWHHDPHALVQVLRETQAQTHWLPRDLLAHIGRALHLTTAHVEGVASFYRFFHLQPVGRVRVLFSDNITDRMAGSDALMARLCERLGVKPGEVDAQGRFSVDRCSCTGLCDQGPALLVNHHQVVTRLDVARVDQLAERLLAGVPPEDWPAEWFDVEDNIRRADVLLQGLPAEAVLQVFQDLHHQPPPPATLLAIRASAFELGTAPSAEALADLDQAVDWACRWLTSETMAEEVPA